MRKNIIFSYIGGNYYIMFTDRQTKTPHLVERFYSKLYSLHPELGYGEPMSTLATLETDEDFGVRFVAITVSSYAPSTILKADNPHLVFLNHSKSLGL